MRQTNTSHLVGSGGSLQDSGRPHFPAPQIHNPGRGSNKQTGGAKRDRGPSVRPSRGRTPRFHRARRNEATARHVRHHSHTYVRTYETNQRAYVPPVLLPPRNSDRESRHSSPSRDPILEPALSRPPPCERRRARAHVDFDRYITSLLASKRARARGRAECDGSGSVTTTATTTTTTRRNVRTRVVP